MKKLLLIILLTFVSTSAMAEWTAIGRTSGESDIYILYADKASIIREGNIARMWSLKDYSLPQNRAYGNVLSTLIERFNRTVRYEWLSQYYWKDIEEVQQYATQWMWRYNNERPNMALGGITPIQRLAMAA